MAVRQQRFHGLSLSQRPTDARNPTAVEDQDPRLRPKSIAAAAVQIWRWGVELPGVSGPTDRERLVPDYILQQPSWAIQVAWNHVVLFNVDSDTPTDGQVYIYRTTDDPPQQRVRMGPRAFTGGGPDPGDRVWAIYYVIDQVGE